VASLLGTRVWCSFAATVELPLVALRTEKADLSRLRVLGNVRPDVRRDDEDPGNGGAFVPYLVASGRTTRERHHVSLAELAVAVVQPDDRLTAQNQDELLASVVKVVDDLGATGLKLPDRSAQRSTFGSNEAARTDATPVGNVGPHVLGVSHSKSD
jgi:hypothetical protein